MTVMPPAPRNLEPYALPPGLELGNRVVVVRADYNIAAAGPDGQPVDDFRLRASLPLLQHLIGKRARVVVLSHRGRPQGAVQAETSTLPIVDILSQLLGQDVGYMPDCVGRAVEQAVADLPGGQVLLLENTRFHLGEQMNQQTFVRQLLRLGEIFINEAYPALHRAHGSLSGLAASMPESYLGPRVLTELGWLDALNDDARGPLRVVLGGMQTNGHMGQQFELLQQLLGRVDTIMLAGVLAPTFMAARDVQVGLSRYDSAYFEAARTFLAEAGACGSRILLPSDFKVTDRTGVTTERSAGRLAPHEWVLAPGKQTLHEWQGLCRKPGRLLWLGTLGLEAQEENCRLAETVAGTQECFSVVGGERLLVDLASGGMRERLPQVSSGHAVLLSALSGQSLPALQVLAGRQTCPAQPDAA